MKIITAFVTVPTFLGFAGASFACNGAMSAQQQAASNTDAPLLPKGESS